MIYSMSVAELPIQLDREKIAEFCRARGIRKLSLFGSVLREDFGPDSDVDVVVRFDEDAHWSLWDFYAVQEALESLFGREVDLIELEGVINPIRKRNILSQMQPVYAVD